MAKKRWSQYVTETSDALDIENGTAAKGELRAGFGKPPAR
jgi:hypothetical protein